MKIILLRCKAQLFFCDDLFDEQKGATSEELQSRFE